ncbi:hypothetical protein [Enhydrobacter aerosaccus]|uniref:hypothetical protein n=1 Tax=Enhydrobacter aerosaccus TaxID=225324 RepID=UPI0011171244|nr:hypothetical protein [Enhydrobacter aerosaccus]
MGAEFFMRGVDLLAQAQSGSHIHGLIFMTLWHAQLGESQGKTMGVRALARTIGLPYETVRRHTLDLMRRGQCVKFKNGLMVPPHVLSRARNVALLRKLYLEATRMLGDLGRIGIARIISGPRKLRIVGQLSKEQTDIAHAGMRSLLAGVRIAMDFADGDLLKALVYSAIWTANVKHITSVTPTAFRTVLPDHLRRPVSVMAVANSLRLPYETTRRHAAALVDQGICVRVGGRGILVPAAFHQTRVDLAVRSHGIVLEFLTELRRAGIKV